MSPLSLILLLQETLPPPPEPTGSPDINTAQVVGVVIISLALIMIGALAIRPMFARKKSGTDTEEVDVSDQPDASRGKEQPNVENASRSIIPFPKPAVTSSTVIDEPWAWPETENAIEDRFNRVIVESGRRRKLGDRQPSVPEIVSPTRIRTSATDTDLAAGARSVPLILPPIVPLRDRRIVAKTNAVDSLMIAEQRGASAGVLRVDMLERSGVSSFEGLSDRSGLSSTMLLEPASERESSSKESDRSGLSELTAELATPVAQEWQTIVTELGSLPARDAIEPTAKGVGAALGSVAGSVEDLKEVESGGSAPSEADVELVALAELEILDSKPITGEEIDEGIYAGIAQTVRNLIYYANAGKLLDGFALYSDPYLFRFMDSTGLDEAGFRERFVSIPPRPGPEWERLDRLSDIVRTRDGRIAATVSYVDTSGKPTNGQERFRFDYSVEHGFWMIDDIQSLD